VGDLYLNKLLRIVDNNAIQRCKERGICEVCGLEGNDPHHIITVRSGGPDHDYNLICVCRSCHTRLHGPFCSVAKNDLFNIVSKREEINIDRYTIYEIMRSKNARNTDNTSRDMYQN